MLRYSSILRGTRASLPGRRAFRAGLWAVCAAGSLLVAASNCRQETESPPSGPPGTGGTGVNCDADQPNGGFPAACAGCHGDADNPAPPPDNWDHTETNSPGVGAHRVVLGDAGWHRMGECTDCHLVPRTANYDPCTPTHDNGKTDIVFAPIAGDASYDPVTRRCSNVYCHGATLGDDLEGETTTVRDPQWTVVDGVQTRCGKGCHTLPPGGDHEVDTACGSCHPRVISTFRPLNPELSEWVNPSLHINGLHEATVD